MSEVVLRPHEAAFADFVAKHDDVVALTGDLTNSTELGELARRLPGRVVSMGMAEQNMVSWAGGMAREGLVPYVHTFSVFIYRRALDQLSMSVAYPCLPVKFMAFLPGLTTPGGVTHQAIDDVAVVRGVPNMTVIETGDATEVESAPALARAIDGPVFVRMLRGSVPRLFPRDQPMEANKCRVLSAGGDVALITSGVCTEEALRATSALKAAGVALTHLHVSTLKPFDDPAVLTACRKARAALTVENHTVVGGLGTAVSEMLAENAIGVPLTRLGLQDTYSHGATLPYLLREHGLDAPAIVRAVDAARGKDSGVTEQDLGAVRVREASSLSVDQLEAL